MDLLLSCTVPVPVVFGFNVYSNVYFVCPPHGGGIKYLGMGELSLFFCDSLFPFLRASEEVE